MSKIVKLVAIAGLTIGVAACGSAEEEEVVIITPEPVSTKF